MYFFIHYFDIFCLIVGAAKITNVAKNLLKICRREILEIETCAECYYNSLVRKDTWFIEVCVRIFLLIIYRIFISRSHC